jgi:hypothetical protein
LSAFFAAGFFAAAAFLAGAFLVAGFLAGALAAAFLASSFTPAFFAAAASADLRREAVFFLIRPFLTALSSSLCAVERVSALGAATKALTAALISF